MAHSVLQGFKVGIRRRVRSAAAVCLLVAVSGTLSPTIVSAAKTQDPWSTGGNSGTNPSVNFLGTTDNSDLVVSCL
jgi:hypothetical protein